ncbi:MAG: endonuclease III domain-containing protein, partial [Nanoarchaeota archaeon]
PVGFYRRKAIVIKNVCERLVNEFKGQVPADLDILLTFEGVGRKTANLVITEGFQKPAMCVDVHVHRISNRLGYIQTKTPEETEFKLREILPLQYWIRYNSLLVAFGQHICKPVSPFCSKCPVEKYCQKVGVKKQR